MHKTALWFSTAIHAASCCESLLKHRRVEAQPGKGARSQSAGRQPLPLPVAARRVSGGEQL